MKRVWTVVALASTAVLLTAALAGPPVIASPPVSIERRVQQDFLYQPDSMSSRQSATYTTSSVGFEYTGLIGPEQPLDVGAIDIATGKYLISFSLPARFSGLTSDPLVCMLVESRSGIQLEPAQPVSYESGAPWTVLQVDMPVALPEMTVALRCSTARATVGRVEIGESSLLAMRIL